ncbi:MAG: viroplasmin family protein [Oligoflexia bacterium]|nr:viroplasmin family protein [Oligoflexia bacterium]
MKKAYPIVIFADGASSGNPGPGGWGAIVAHPDGRVQELGGGDPSTTNNRMELVAVIRALRSVENEPGAVAIFTDSVYVIRGITQWVWAWRKRGWKTAEGTEVANPDLWKALMGLLAQRDKSFPVEWKFVRGHSGIPGNERVDAIAVSFSKGRPVPLYSGSLLNYGVAIHDIPENTELPEMRPKEAPKPPAHSYLSLVGGTPMRHKTWAECEKRVKGVSGAKFKKTASAEEEAQVLSSWGFRPEQLK